jgi:hypothetical protein
MATRTYTASRLQTMGDDVQIITWAGLLQSSSDDGNPFASPGWADRSVQVTGTLGAGGSVRMEGSNDGTNYVTLTDPQGNALDITTLKIETITELCAFIRPRVTAGDGTTNLNVIMLARR